MVHLQPGAVHEAMTERARALRGSICNVCVTGLVVGAEDAVCSGLTPAKSRRLRFPIACAYQGLTTSHLLFPVAAIQRLLNPTSGMRRASWWAVRLSG
jgi:hypothetical protein